MRKLIAGVNGTVGGTISKADIRQVVSGYGNPPFNLPEGAGGITPIPEPSTIVFLAMGIVLLVLRRRSSQ